MKLRALAPGKVNLGLFLGPVRADGRHELVTLFESVSLADELSLSVLTRDAPGDEVVCPGIAERENLVSRTLGGLRRLGWDAPPVRIEIVKRIPIAAGMGGGSADAAAALRMAVELAPGRPEELASLAASLGADVPSQLVPGLVLGSGAGELVEPFEPLAPHALVIAPRQHALSTAAVYREADALGLPRGSEQLAVRYQQLVAALQPGAVLPSQLIANDLEQAAMSLCPAIAQALQAIREAGADQAFVCGSGPTAAGLFWGADAPGRAAAAARAVAPRFRGAASVLPVSAEVGSPRFA
jgi:4-diphosphocytidyl-2-C-methyl-D-erythritol kinase